MQNLHKKTLLLLFFSCFFFFTPPAEAEEVISGNFYSTQDFLKKIPEKLTIIISDNKYSLSKSLISDWISEEANISYDPSYHSEIENTSFCKYKKSLVCELSFDIRKENHIRKKSILTIDSDKIGNYVSTLANQNDQNAQNAKLKIENGKVSVFSLDQKGTKLRQDEGKITLINYLKKGDFSSPIVLAYDELKPDVMTDSIDNMGITSLIGEGRSNFRGSPKNRIFNIKAAVEKFDGLLIKPNEEFSFVKNLGPVDGEHGYLPELVIKRDKTEPEFGGGICQVSTTAFRAAIYSGLKITARRNHAYPVGYYNPQGMDSTVYVPWPDLRFINNTPSYILIQVKIVGTELIFDFFGTDDGRKTNVLGPTILERNPDGSMKTTFTQQVSGKDGNLIREDVFNSHYDSPSKFPHPAAPGDILTQKPEGWSDKEWKNYQKSHTP